MGNAATQGKGHRASLATSTWSLPGVGIDLAREEGSPSPVCPGRSRRGPGGLGEPGERGAGERKGSRRSPGRGVSR